MAWVYIENLGDVKSIPYHKARECKKEEANALVPPFCTYSDYTGTSLEAANVRYLEEKVSEAICLYGDYGTTSVAIPKTALTEELIEEIEALQDYPVFDEELMSEIEHDREHEAMDDLRKDLQRELIKLPWLTVRQEESLNVTDELIRELMERSNSYFEHETGGGVYVDLRRLAEAFKPGDIKLKKRGVSRKAQRKKERNRTILANKRFKERFRSTQARRRVVGISRIRLKPTRIPRWNDKVQ